MEKLINGLSIIMSWCSKHCDGKGKSTRHLWIGWKLICLECNPEKDPAFVIGQEMAREVIEADNV